MQRRPIILANLKSPVDSLQLQRISFLVDSS